MGKISTGDGAVCQGGSPKAQRLSQAGKIVFVIVFCICISMIMAMTNRQLETRKCHCQVCGREDLRLQQGASD